MPQSNPTASSYNPGSAFTPTSGYSTRTNPITGNGSQFHPGQDYGAPAGTPIPAASDGTVIYSVYNGGGYGNTVVIRSIGADGNSYDTLSASKTIAHCGISEVWHGPVKISRLGQNGFGANINLLFQRISKMNNNEKAIRAMHFQILLVVGLLLFGLSCSCIAIENATDKAISNDLIARGKQFRAEIESVFTKMSKADARRSYDLIEVCKKYIPVGTSFTDVEMILHAAGDLDNLQAAYNRFLPADSPDRSDVAGGFILEKSYISNAQFIIIFRPEYSNGINKKVSKIMSCGVRSIHL